MSKVSEVAKNELVNVLTRPSYLIFTFGVPMLAFIAFLFFSNLSNKDPQVLSSLVQDPGQNVLLEGLVDPGNVIQYFPNEAPEESFVKFADETEALAALNKEEISAYYVVSPDVFDSGEFIYIRPDFNPLSESGQDWRMSRVLTFNLFNADKDQYAYFQTPIIYRTIALSPSQTSGNFNGLSFVIPYAITMLFYVVILSAASLLLNSVVAEKQNRVIEVVMLSLTPRQLLTGKIIGLGLVGLIQSSVYLLVGTSLLKLAGRSVQLPPGLGLPIEIFIWGMLFFVLGYTLYASLMAGLGALVPNIREASQSTILVIAPLIIPMLCISFLIQKPHGTLSLLLSLVPLTSPVAMMTRIASGGVPIWQILLSMALLILTAGGVIRVVSGFFRAQTLLTGQDFKASTYFKAMLGKL